MHRISQLSRESPTKRVFFNAKLQTRDVRAFVSQKKRLIMVYQYSRVNGEKCSSKYTQGNRVSREVDEENTTELCARAQNRAAALSNAEAPDALTSPQEQNVPCQATEGVPYRTPWRNPGAVW